MRKIEQLWRTLEEMPILSGVQIALEKIFGEDFPVIKSFLKPMQELASTYPCPEPGGDGCPRGVVVHAPGDIVAVCRRTPRSCETIALTKKDVIVYELDQRLLSSQLGSFFGFSGNKTPEPVKGLSYTFYLGDYQPVAGYRFPAYFTIQNGSDEISQVVELLRARDTRRFILLTPTTRSVAPSCSEMLRTYGSVVYGLSDITEADASMNLVMCQQAEEVLSAFRDAILKEASKETEDGMIFFPTPPNATWSDVEIRFRDGHKVSVKVFGEQGVFNFTQMGMASNKSAEPTLQWKLLQHFAEEKGVLTWDSSHADRKNQKRRELLSRALRRFFRIEGDPITLSDDKKGWRVLFSLHPES